MTKFSENWLSGALAEFGREGCPGAGAGWILTRRIEAHKRNGGQVDTESLYGSFITSSGCLARRKLLVLHQARSLNDLRVPYGNRLEALKDDRKGQHSIRINDQWRVCFRWQGEDALDVEIVDYH